MTSQAASPRLTPKFVEAMPYAAEKHATQTRKGSEIRYLGQDPSLRAPAAGPAPSEVRPGDVVDPSAAIRSRRPQPARALRW